MDMVTQVMNKINDVINDDYLIKIARETKFIQRERKVMPRKFVENMMTTTLCHSTSSLEDLAAVFESEDLSISKQALHQKMNVNAVEFFKKILEALLEKSFSVHSVNLTAIPCIQEVIIGDSSQVALDASLKEQCPGSRNIASVKIQAIMNAVNNQIKSLEIVPGTETDQGYRKHWQFIQKGTLWIGDLGYFAIDTFRHVIDQEAFFLSRYFRRATLLNPLNGELIHLKELLSNTLENTVELGVILGAEGVSCRCIAIRLNQKEYENRLKNLQEQNRKNGKKKKRKWDVLDEWTILVTNLPDEVEASILWRLYILRWQIELLFKLMKTFLSLRKVEHSNYFRAMISIYSSLIAVVLLVLITVTIEDQEISLYKACRLFIRHIGLFFASPDSEKPRVVSWLKEKIYLFASKETRKKRPSSRQSLGWGVIAYA
jgi:Transposase DDE domain